MVEQVRVTLLGDAAHPWCARPNGAGQRSRCALPELPAGPAAVTLRCAAEYEVLASRRPSSSTNRANPPDAIIRSARAHWRSPSRASRTSSWRGARTDVATYKAFRLDVWPGISESTAGHDSRPTHPVDLAALPRRMRLIRAERPPAKECTSRLGSRQEPRPRPPNLNGRTMTPRRPAVTAPCPTATELTTTLDEPGRTTTRSRRCT